MSQVPLSQISDSSHSALKLAFSRRTANNPRSPSHKLKMATLQMGFSTRLLTFALLLIALVAGTFAAPLRVDHKTALPPTGVHPPRPGPTDNIQRSTNAEYLGVDMTIFNQASSGDLFIRNAHLNW